MAIGLPQAFLRSDVNSISMKLSSTLSRDPAYSVRVTKKADALRRITYPENPVRVPAKFAALTTPIPSSVIAVVIVCIAIALCTSYDTFLDIYLVTNSLPCLNILFFVNTEYSVHALSWLS